MKPYDECNDFEKAARDLQGLRSLKWHNEIEIKNLKERVDELRDSREKQRQERHHDVLCLVLKESMRADQNKRAFVEYVSDAKLAADLAYPSADKVEWARNEFRIEGFYGGAPPKAEGT